MKTTRTAAAAKATIQTLGEVARDIGRMGKIDRELEELEKELNAELENIRAKLEPQIQDFKKEREKLFEGIQNFAETHRDELCQKKRKSVNTAHGRFGWRKDPASVKFNGVKPAEIVEILKANNLKDLIRIKEEPNKEAMLQDPARVEGIKEITVVEESEKFFISPKKEEV